MTQSAKCCNSVSNNLANAPNLKGAPMKHTDVKKDKAMMQKAVNKHEGRLHKGATPTKLAKGGMPMAMKDGKKVPAFAADGKGKMAAGGMAMNGRGVAKRGCN
jgi:hypothetical protein